MEHARASTLPLASIAALLRGDDPDAVWRTTAADLGWLAFANACDGERGASRGRRQRRPRRGPRAVRRRRRVRGARAWRTRPAAWLTQVHRDARLALTALDVLDGERAVDTILGMGVRWQASRRSPTTVFGPRCSVRVLIGQADDGTWQVEPGAIEHDQNAIDVLVPGAERSEAVGAGGCGGRAPAEPPGEGWLRRATSVAAEAARAPRSSPQASDEDWPVPSPGPGVMWTRCVGSLTSTRCHTPCGTRNA